MNKLFLIRHGECKSALLNEDDIVGNDEVNGLTDDGVKAVQLLAEGLQKLLDSKPVKIYASPVLRAKQTAEIIAEKLNVPIFFDDKLAERRFDFSYPLKLREYITLQEKLIADPSNELTGFESIKKHRERVEQFFDAIRVDKKEEILIIAHGGTIEHVFGYIQQSPFDNCKQFFGKLDYAHCHQFSYFYNQIINSDKPIFRLDRFNHFFG